MKIFLPALFFLCAAQAQTSLTPAQVSAAIDAQGAKHFVRHLSHAAFGDMMHHVDDGDADWIAVIPKLAPGMQGLKGDKDVWQDAIPWSLTNALPKNAAAVLKALADDPKNYDFGIDVVCSGGWGNMPSPQWVANYKAQAIAAVTAARASNPARADRCLHDLEKLGTPQP